MTTVNEHFDVAIIGAGPSGMFVAHKLLSDRKDAKVVLFDKGKDPKNRVRDFPISVVCGQEINDIISGGGGAGLFSDGKLVLSLRAGGNASGVFESRDEKNYIQYIEDTLVQLDGYSMPIQHAASNIYYTPASKLCVLQQKPYNVRHFGTDNLRSVLTQFFDKLASYHACDIRFESIVTGISIDENGKYCISYVNESDGEQQVTARYVVFAVGKEGSVWLSQLLSTYGVKSKKNRTYFGVRIEVNTFSNLKGISADPKLYWEFSDGTKIKTHCYCKEGEIIRLRYYGRHIAGGHSLKTDKNSGVFIRGRTSVSILLGDTPRQKFDFDDCIKYMDDVNQLTGGKLLVQKLCDFIKDKPTTPELISSNSVEPSTHDIVAGSVSALNLPLDFNRKFIWFVRQLGKIDEAFARDDVLVYAPVIEWWMNKIETNESFETSLRNVFVVGDGAGVSQGIMYSAATGLVAAEEIGKRFRYHENDNSDLRREAMT